MKEKIYEYIASYYTWAVNKLFMMNNTLGCVKVLKALKTIKIAPHTIIKIFVWSLNIFISELHAWWDHQTTENCVDIY